MVTSPVPTTRAQIVVVRACESIPKMVEWCMWGLPSLVAPRAVRIWQADIVRLGRPHFNTLGRTSQVRRFGSYRLFQNEAPVKSACNLDRSPLLRVPCTGQINPCEESL